MNDDLMSTARDQGYQAARAGQHWSLNPYTDYEDQGERDAWFAGWDSYTEYHSALEA